MLQDRIIAERQRLCAQVASFETKDKPLDMDMVEALFLLKMGS